MGTSTLLTALNMEPAHVVRGTNTDTLNEKNALNLKLMKVLEAHQSVENNIRSNESLTQQGKAEALTKLGTTETAPALKWLSRVVEAHQQTDQNYRTKFFTVTSGLTDPAERLPIFVYLWRKFDLLDPHTRVTRFFLAAEQDQTVVLSAMLEHPEGAMVDEEVKEKALLARATRLMPQQVEAFEQNAILLEWLEMIANWVGRWLALENRVEIPVIRTNLGDDIADALQQHVTGIPVST